jgi:hypothetical protein
MRKSQALSISEWQMLLAAAISWDDPLRAVQVAGAPPGSPENAHALSGNYHWTLRNDRRSFFRSSRLFISRTRSQ